MAKLTIEFETEKDDLKGIMEDLLSFQKVIVDEVNRFVADIEADADPECGGGSVYDDNFRIDLDLY